MVTKNIALNALNTVQYDCEHFTTWNTMDKENWDAIVEQIKIVKAYLENENEIS